MAEKKPYRVSTSELLRTSFALDRHYADMVNQLRRERNISQTDYMKGLVALDWLDTTKQPLDITKVPPWIIVAYKLDVREGKVQPRKPRD